ncbi:MAG: molybdopterin-guanine dinucleotide biosynthesis protein B [Candidatus Sericytochromatia bacterium]|nr:molybdopterin-guanine dinucleotide biosynthesis protein B [Candidatus Tanganyikabacteria bacterium]
MSGPFVVAIVGVSNSGKTTLIEQLLPLLRARGLRVGTLKHNSHDFAIDYPGKDTWRHREAGAEVVVIANEGKVAAIRNVRACPSPAELIADYMADLDLVLVEGFKQFPLPKIEVVRAGIGTGPICPIESLEALVTDLAVPDCQLPTFALYDAPGVAELVLAIAGRTSSGERVAAHPSGSSTGPRAAGHHI